MCKKRQVLWQEAELGPGLLRRRWWKSWRPVLIVQHLSPCRWGNLLVSWLAARTTAPGRYDNTGGSGRSAGIHDLLI